MLTDLTLVSADLLFLSKNVVKEFETPSLGTDDDPIKLRILILMLLRFVSDCYDSTGVFITI